MGPERAAEIFKKRYPDAARYRAILYGSLASTGKGHLTDIALKKILHTSKAIFIGWIAASVINNIILIFM